MVVGGACRLYSGANTTNATNLIDTVPVNSCVDCDYACQGSSRCVQYMFRSSVKQNIVECLQSACMHYDAAGTALIFPADPRVVSSQSFQITGYGEVRFCTSCWATCDSNPSCASYSFGSATRIPVATRCDGSSGPAPTPAPVASGEFE